MKDLDYPASMKAALGYEQSCKASGTIKANTTMVTEGNVMYTQEQIEGIVSRDSREIQHKKIRETQNRHQPMQMSKLSTALQTPRVK